MFRQIIHPANSNELIIRLPEEYISKDVEIIAFEIEEKPLNSDVELSRAEKINKAFEVFDKYRVSTKGYKFDRDEANER